MTSRWMVTTPTGWDVFRGTKAECKAYIKQALKKGSEEGYLRIEAVKEAKRA